MPSAAAKRALLAGAAIAALWAPASLVHAQQPAAPAPAPAAPGPDGLQPGELYMEADEVIRDDKAKVTTAAGNVEVRYENRTLRADRLSTRKPRTRAARGSSAPAATS